MVANQGSVGIRDPSQPDFSPLWQRPRAWRSVASEPEPCWPPRPCRSPRRCCCRSWPSTSAASARAPARTGCRLGSSGSFLGSCSSAPLPPGEPPASPLAHPFCIIFGLGRRFVVCHVLTSTWGGRFGVPRGCLAAGTLTATLLSPQRRGEPRALREDPRVPHRGQRGGGAAGSPR